MPPTLGQATQVHYWDSRAEGEHERQRKRSPPAQRGGRPGSVGGTAALTTLSRQTPRAGAPEVSAGVGWQLQLGAERFRCCCQAQIEDPGCKHAQDNLQGRCWGSAGASSAGGCVAERIRRCRCGLPPRPPPARQPAALPGTRCTTTAGAQLQPEAPPGRLWQTGQPGRARRPAGRRKQVRVSRQQCVGAQCSSAGCMGPPQRQRQRQLGGQQQHSAPARPASGPSPGPPALQAAQQTQLAGGAGRCCRRVLRCPQSWLPGRHQGPPSHWRLPRWRRARHPRRRAAAAPCPP